MASKKRKGKTSESKASSKTQKTSIAEVDFAAITLESSEKADTKANNICTESVHDDAAVQLADSTNKSLVETSPGKPKLGFFDLPPEIRLSIYQYVVDEDRYGQRARLCTGSDDFIGHSYIQVKRSEKYMVSTQPSARKGMGPRYKSTYTTRNSSNKRTKTSYIAYHTGWCLEHQYLPLGLMWVCRTIRREATPVLLQNRAIVSAGPDCLLQFLRDLSPLARNSVRHIHLTTPEDFAICSYTQDAWLDLFGYMAANTSLKKLHVVLNCEDMNENETMPNQQFIRDAPNWRWVRSLCKLQNLERLGIVVRYWDEDIGQERWIDCHSELDPDFALEEYDDSWSWIEDEKMTAAVEEMVGARVLTGEAEQKARLHPRLCGCIPCGHVHPECCPKCTFDRLVATFHFPSNL